MFRLLGISFLARLVGALFISTPRSLDECYYFMVARNLFEGKGFTTDIEWNFLAGSGGVPPCASNRFWMPLSSMILAPFFHFLGPGYRVAQIPMVIIGSLVPMTAYLLGCMVFRDRTRRLSVWALTLVSPWFFIYWGSVDNFGLYALVASSAFLAFRLAAVAGDAWAVPAGILSGLSHLSRADGALVAVAGGFWYLVSARGRRPGRRIAVMALAGVCYFLVMGPWFARNLEVFGSPMSPESCKTVFMTSYNQLFHYNEVPSAGKFFSRGVGKIIGEKAVMIRDSLLYIMTGPLAVFLVPLFLAGLAAVRWNHPEVPHLFYGFLMFGVLVLVFTYPSQKGTLWHSSAALLPLLHVVSVRGATVFVLLAGRLKSRTTGKFSGSSGPSSKVGNLLGVTVAMSAILCVVYTATYIHFWRVDYDAYRPAFAWVAGANASTHPGARPRIVMTPLPGFANYCEGLTAIIMPMDGRKAVLDAARQRGVEFLVARKKSLARLEIGAPVEVFGDVWVVRLDPLLGSLESGSSVSAGTGAVTGSRGEVK